MSHRLPTITSLSYEPAIAIRRASDHDRATIARLAALDSKPEPGGTVLVGEVDGEAWAALSLEDGHTVADPFRRSAGIVDLLRARASGGQTRKAGRPILAPRWAA